MKTSTKRATSVGVSLAAVGAIIVGSVAFANGVTPNAAEPTPSPTVSVEPSDITPPEPAVDTIERQAAAVAEAERLAAEAEAARVAAEQAAAAEAARIAAEQEAARQAEESRTVTTEQSAPSNPDNPAPPPAPAPAPVSCPAGLTAVEYDGAGNAVGCMDPSCFTGEIEGNDPRCVVVRP